MMQNKTTTPAHRDEILKQLDKIICKNCSKDSCIPDSCETHILINELYRKTEIED